MHQGNQSRPKAIAAVAVAAVLTAICAAAQAQVTLASGQILEPAVWQGPALSGQANGAPLTPPNSAVMPAVGNAQNGASALRVALQPSPPVPPQQIDFAPSPGPAPQRAVNAPVNGSNAVGVSNGPLLDGDSPTEELMPPVVQEEPAENRKHIVVQPYGGGHPNDWSWGCGGSPYRNGPGLCDNWKVGPRWHVTVDGLVLSREQTNLTALVQQMRDSYPFMSSDGTPAGDGTTQPPFSENFHYGPGGRITFASQIARCTGYDLQAVYEGINDWNASLVFPKEALEPVTLVIPPVPDTEPPPPFPEGFQQRSLHYRSNLNSGELNFMTSLSTTWRPYYGVRFIRLDDSISDVLDQERQVPMAGPRTETVPTGGTPAVQVTVNDPIGPTFETDRINNFDLENNLMGFQIGLFHDTVKLSNRLAIEGFVSGGVYYNQVKYNNTMGIFTTQSFADNTRSTGTTDSRVDTSNIVNGDSRDFAEISYVSEASLTGVCRLNKCWALRGGYQVLWINNVHTADTAFLGNPDQTNTMLFQGWHAGVECRR